MQLRRSSRQTTINSTMASMSLAEQREKKRQEKIQLKLLTEAKRLEEEERFRVVPQWLVALDGYFDIDMDYPASQVVASRTYHLMETASKSDRKSRETPILYKSYEVPKADQSTVEIETPTLDDSSKWAFEPESNNNDVEIVYDIYENEPDQCAIVKEENAEPTIEEISFAEPTTPIQKQPIKKLNRQRLAGPAETDPLTDAINYLNETVSEYDVNLSFESTMCNSTVLLSEEETDDERSNATLRSDC